MARTVEGFVSDRLRQILKTPLDVPDHEALQREVETKHEMARQAAETVGSRIESRLTSWHDCQRVFEELLQKGPPGDSDSHPTEESVSCSICNHENRLGVKFCTHCGAKIPIPPSICTNCGSQR